MIDDDRRKHPRVELMAQVQVTRDADVHILRARDVSRGGLFLAGRPETYAEFVVGADLEIVLFAAGSGEGDDLDDVAARARIVRVVPSSADGRKHGGFGLAFSALEDKSAARLRALIARATPPGRRG